MDGATNINVKQATFLAVIIVLLLVGACFWALATDSTDQVIGGVLMAIGLLLVVPFALVRDKVLTERQALKANGRRVDAPINAVVYEGGLQNVHYYHLELKDPHTSTALFVSDPLPGTGTDVQKLLNDSRQFGLENMLTLPVYVDPNDTTRYFVDVSGDVASYLASKTVVS